MTAVCRALVAALLAIVVSAATSYAYTTAAVHCFERGGRPHWFSCQQAGGAK
jgi:hypothetical protein